ncbi:MAG: RcnB family protein [Lysobacterales bacterium]
MKIATTRKAVLMAATALALGMLSGQALAKDHDNHGHGHDEHGDYDDHGHHGQDDHWDNGRHGPPPWARGHDYRGYGYARVVIVPVPEYRRYELYAPRPGYRWVRDDAGHYLLVSIASGIISDILYRNGL